MPLYRRLTQRVDFLKQPHSNSGYMIALFCIKTFRNGYAIDANSRTPTSLIRSMERERNLPLPTSVNKYPKEATLKISLKNRKANCYRTGNPFLRRLKRLDCIGEKRT